MARITRLALRTSIKKLYNKEKKDHKRMGVRFPEIWAMRKDLLKGA